MGWTLAGNIKGPAGSGWPLTIRTIATADLVSPTLAQYAVQQSDVGTMLSVDPAVATAGVVIANLTPGSGIYIYNSDAANTHAPLVMYPGGNAFGTWPTPAAASWELPPHALMLVVQQDKYYQQPFGGFADLPFALPNTTTAYSIASMQTPGGVVFTSDSAATATLTGDGAFTVPGMLCPIRQGGQGTVTIVGDTGVTVNAVHGNTTSGLGDVRVAEYLGNDTWNVY